MIGFILTALILRMQNIGTTYFTSALFAFLLVFGISFYNWFLGIFLSGILVFIIMAFSRKIEIKYLISFTLILLISFGISLLLKTNLQNYFLISGDLSIFNDSDINFFSLNNIVALLRVSFAQLWYLGIASFLLVYLGIYYLTKKCFSYTISLIKRKTAENTDFSAIFIFLGFVTTFIISSLSTQNYGNVNITPYLEYSDKFIYGRYNILMFLPLTLYVFKTIIDAKKSINWKEITLFISVSLIFIFQSLWILSFFEHHHLYKQFMYVSVINFIIYDSIIVGCIATMMVFTFICIELLNKKRDYILPIILLTIVVINIYAGYTFIQNM